MPQQIIFTSVAAKSGVPNKDLKKDENGYYDIVLGALNTFNSAGEFYTLEGAKELFEESSALMRRIKSGQLRSEVGHPKQMPGMSFKDYLYRILRIEETNICAHIKEVWFQTSDKREPGASSNKVIIWGKVKPAGVHARALEENLENPDANCAFSIRSLTRNTIIKGITHKTLNQVVTWDWVNEPGISVATKWHALGIESRDILRIDLEDAILCQELTNSLRDTISVSNESGEKELLQCILSDISSPKKEDTSIHYNW